MKKNKLSKLFKKKKLKESELDNFIKTLVKLSKLNVIPSRPKRALKRLGVNDYFKLKNK